MIIADILFILGIIFLICGYRKVGIACLAISIVYIAIALAAIYYAMKHGAY